jgi:cytochrome c biogenesis protein CcdA
VIVAGIGPDGPVAVYLAAGMVATVNPCGFAMLPAYLSYFLGSGEDDDDASSSSSSSSAAVAQALRVALAVAAGFLAVFGVAGLAVELTSLPVYENVPWISIVVGAALVVLGAVMLTGRELLVRLPKLERGTSGRDARSMFVFGVSYAVASIGCTLPTFLVAVSGTMRRQSVLDGLMVFGVYGLGMALVLTALTVALALARTSLVAFLRRSQQYVTRVSGALMVLAGLYVAYYGILELRAFDDAGSVPESGVTATVTGWSYDVQTWVNDAGATRIAAVAALALAVVVGVVTLRSRTGGNQTGPSGDQTTVDDRAGLET